MSNCLIPIALRAHVERPCPVPGCPCLLTSVRPSYSDRRQTFLAHLRRRHEMGQREASLVADQMAREAA